MGIVLEFAQHQALAARSSTGYKSGRSSWRGTPVARSTANTRKGGTSSHCDTAWAEIPRALPREPTPPALEMARCNASVLSVMTRHESLAFTESQARLGCAGKAALYHVGMSLGKRIKKARKALGLTQGQVGKHFGITSQAVAQWENDPDKGPQRDRMPELARFLGVTLGWLNGVDETTNDLVDLINSLSPAQRRRAIRLLTALSAEEEDAA